MQKLHAPGLFLLVVTLQIGCGIPPVSAIDLKHSDFAIKTLKIPNSPARASPEFHSFSVQIDQNGDTYLTTGLGLEKLSIPDDPGAGIWRVRVTDAQPTLEEAPVADDLKRRLTVNNASQGSLPFGCGAGFVEECSSQDGKLHIALTFDGKRYKKKMSSIFQSNVEYEFRDGIRKLVITDNTTGKKAVFHEQLDDTPEYLSYEGRLIYLAKEKLVILFSPIGSSKPTPTWAILFK